MQRQRGTDIGEDNSRTEEVAPRTRQTERQRGGVRVQRQRGTDISEGDSGSEEVAVHAAVALQGLPQALAGLVGRQNAMRHVHLAHLAPVTHTSKPTVTE